MVFIFRQFSRLPHQLPGRKLCKGLQNMTSKQAEPSKKVENKLNEMETRLVDIHINTKRQLELMNKQMQLLENMKVNENAAQRYIKELQKNKEQLKAEIEMYKTVGYIMIPTTLLAGCSVIAYFI